MNEISYYTKCQCGAITLQFKDGSSNSIKESNLEKFGINLTDVKFRDTYIYACNHCSLNHYGLDLCECGSGLEPHECCNKEAKEEFGKSVKFEYKR